MSAIWFGKTALADLGDAGPLDASMGIDQLSRVATVVVPPSGPVAITMSFDQHDNVVLVDAALTGSVSVSCQRCLEPLRIPLDTALRVALVDSDQMAVNAPDGYETVVATDGQIKLLDLVEDEILLEIPFAARHAAGDCGPLAKKVEGLQSKPDTATPFAGLGELMRDKGNG